MTVKIEKFCGQRRIARQASMECVRLVTIYASKTTVLRMLDKYPNIVQSQKNVSRTDTSVQERKASLSQNIHGIRLGKDNFHELFSCVGLMAITVNESVIRNLVNSMPEQIFQVINRNGSCTDY
uniref:Transposase n=1 Tax=Heterorhabditis bacteriophora TaxID=37862 RepID=A0A1I7WAK3_HETBA